MDFFEAQFRRQVQDHDYALNPFETLAIEHLKGDILELGSGLGNLSLEAARRGHHVVAVDASPTAAKRLGAEARRENLPVEAIHAAVEDWKIDRTFDTIVAIGLLMFFRRPRALELLQRIKAHVRPGGHAIVNVLVQGTTYLGMFDPHNYYLFARSELEESFADWTILLARNDTFPAPGQTLKQFSTLIASKPNAAR